MDDKLKEIEKTLGREQLLLYLAEECAELSQACLKMVRADRGTAFRPYGQCVDNLAEEITDVKLCIKTVEDVMSDVRQLQYGYKEKKTDRWHSRVCGGGNNES